jgi:hypothetical protein
MKNYFLFLTLMFTSCHLLPASSLAPHLLCQAIASKNTDEAIALIKNGAADTTEVDSLQVVQAEGPHTMTRLALWPLALATFFEQPAVVKELLGRGHSPLQPVSLDIQRKENQKLLKISLTTLDFAIRCKKSEAAILQNHLEMLALLQTASFPTDNQTVTNNRPDAQMSQVQEENDNYDDEDEMYG